jgi:hypothetical protein
LSIFFTGDRSKIVSIIESSLDFTGGPFKSLKLDPPGCLLSPTDGRRI